MSPFECPFLPSYRRLRLKLPSVGHKPDLESNKNVLAAPRALPHFLAPALQRLLHKRHELVGDGAVDEAVVVA